MFLVTVTVTVRLRAAGLYKCYTITPLCCFKLQYIEPWQENTLHWSHDLYN